MSEPKGRVLIIAGSDSGGGAGIQADIKTVTMLGGYAMTAITAVTVQNTLGVTNVHAVPPEIVREQIDAVMSDLGADAWKLGMLGGPVFNDGRYNERFYEVKPEFAAPGRPAFAAPGGGFGGFEFIVALSKRYPSFWVGGFARYDTLKGAVFEASPLVTSKHYVAGGIAITWIFKESTTRVPVNEFGEEIRK